MAKSVGLDIHARGVRAVEIAGRGKSFRVLRYMEREVTPRGGVPDAEELHEALEDIFKGGKFTKNHVVTAVDAHETVVREIPVPFKSDDQIRKVVKYEAEHHLHDCDADDVIVQYTKVGESGDGTNLLVFAARKDDIGRRIEYARAAGVEPLAMGLDALAFFTAVRAAGLLEESPSCVLMNLGHKSTELVFVVDGEVRALRSVRMGVDTISAGLARDMEIDVTDAGHKVEEISEEEEAAGDLFIPVHDEDDKPETRKTSTELERDLFHHKRDEFVARLKREFVRSTAALRGAGSPDRLIATGPGLHVAGLLELAGRRLGLSVESFRPSESFTCKLNGQGAEFDAGGAVALGLALKGIGNDPLELDFRQEELRVANKFELLKNALAVAVTLCFLALLVFSFTRVIKKRQLVEQRFEPMLTRAWQQLKETSDQFNGLGDLVPTKDHSDPNAVEARGERHLALQRFIDELKRMRRHLHKAVGDSKNLDPIRSALGTWNELFKTVGKLHEEIDYIDFELIDIRQKQVSVTMIVRSAADAEALESEFKKLEAIQGMELDPWAIEPVRNTNFQRVRFQFKERRRR